MTRINPVAVIVALVLAALAVLAGYQAREAGHARLAAVKSEAAFAAYRAEVSLATQRAQLAEARRAAEEREKQREALNAERTERLAAQAAARRADAESGRLQQRVDELAAAADASRPPEGGAFGLRGPATDTPGRLLAEMFRRLDSFAGELARFADEARIAGLTCERSYDALTPDVARTDHESDPPPP